MRWNSTRLQRRECCEDRRYEWQKMYHPIRWRPYEQNVDRHGFEILLELDTAVHRDERVVFGSHPSKKLAVRDPCPATLHHRVDTVVTCECRGEIYGELLVKKDAHQPTT